MSFVKVFLVLPDIPFSLRSFSVSGKQNFVTQTKPANFKCGKVVEMCDSKEFNW
jgi:hypothetical protein